ncbi:MAG: hypothetical protein Q9196_003239 [Gyalolechia fulgens]
MTEQISPETQFIPLAPLSTIVELPKQEPPEKGSDTNPPASTQASQGLLIGTLQDSNQVAKSGTSDSMEKQEVENYGAGKSPGFPDSREAASIPLPKSPDSDDPLDPSEPLRSTALTDDPGSTQQPSPRPQELQAEVTEQMDRPNGKKTDTWASRLSSILPQARSDQPTGQTADPANTQRSRAPSIAPGAYPESDSMEETPKPTPGSDVEEPRAETGGSQTNLLQKRTRPRKSVSIILPNVGDDAERTKTDSHLRKGDESIDPTGPSLEEKPKTRTEAKESPHADAVVQNERPRQASQYEQHKEDTVSGSEEPEEGNEKVSAPQPDPELLFLKPSQTSKASPASSIAASQGTDKTDLLTLHERESLAPSDADNSSLNPLLSSSPRYARSSHFSESLGDNRSELMPTERGKAVAPNHETDADSPPIVDDMSNISTISSSISSKVEKRGVKRESEYPFPPIDNGEGPSHIESSQLAPKIVIKDASEAESSRQSPPLRAPATTPVQDGSTPRRRATFIALGDPSDQGPVRLPMKRRKLYLRKARYHVLRQPVLNVTLGRQVGAQAKLALRKLANGELIIIEPPASL